MPDPFVDRIMGSYADWMAIGERQGNRIQELEKQDAVKSARIAQLERALTDGGLAVPPANAPAPPPQEPAKSATDVAPNGSAGPANLPQATLASRAKPTEKSP